MPKVGKWRLLARLGSGGQAMVYLGVDNSGAEAAVKVLHLNWDECGTLQRDLERELTSVRRLAPFLTARVLDFDLTGPVPFIASEYIEGPTLAESVRENGTLKESSLHQIAMQTMTALEAIHEARLIHCDFKPANIILGRHGTRIIDFGIARTLDSTHRVGEVAGTIPFMAPEQIVSAHLSPKVDLFAWGSTMVFAATGRKAFPGDDPTTVRRHILRDPPQLFDLDDSLRNVVRLCLRKDPDKRPTSAEARRMLLGFRSPPVSSSRPSASPTPAVQPAAHPAGRPAAATAARPPAFLRGVATPGGGRPGPAPTRVDRPAVRPVPQPAPPRGVPAPTAGQRPTWGKWWLALAAAVAVVGIIGVTKVGFGNSDRTNKSGATTAADATTKRIVTASSPDISPFVKTYLADWPEATATCKPDDVTSSKVLLARWSCSLIWSGETLMIYCAQYPSVPVMDQKGRPAEGRPNNKRVRWDNHWRSSDGARNGAFVSYAIDSDNARIWWQDTNDPVACMLDGRKGSDEVLLDAFLKHGFTLDQPVPSAS
jgi:hypothetical protein